MVCKMSPKWQDGNSLSGKDKSTLAAPQRHNEFARRSTTDIRIQSLLHRDAQRVAESSPTTPELSSPASLEEQTSPDAHLPVLHDDAPPDPEVGALLDRIAAVDGFLGAAVLDADLGELLLTRQDARLGDVARSAYLSFASLPTLAYSQELREIITTTAAHYEFTTIFEAPTLSLVLFTLWERAGTNLVLAHMEISAALATCARRHVARLAAR